MLSQNPHVMDRLYEEIQTQLPDGRRPTFDDIKNMRYMRAVLNETLRLYPPVYVSLDRIKDRAHRIQAVQYALRYARCSLAINQAWYGGADLRTQRDCVNKLSRP